MTQTIALPTMAPGGMDATVSDHFGHADVFTLVTLDDGQVTEVKTVANPPHAQGGCLAPVGVVAQAGAKAFIAGGMGMRPLMGFGQAGVEVFHHGGATTVSEAVKAFAEGRLSQFDQRFTCGGGGGQM